MIHKHYRVVLSRDVLMTCPGGSGVLQTDTVEAVLLVPDVPRAIATTFEGKMDGFCFPGPWKIVKMDVELHDPSVQDEREAERWKHVAWALLNKYATDPGTAKMSRGATLHECEAALGIHEDVYRAVKAYRHGIEEPGPDSIPGGEDE